MPVQPTCLANACLLRRTPPALKLRRPGNLRFVLSMFLEHSRLPLLAVPAEALAKAGGERGIRTLDAPFKSIHDFQSCSFDHSDTSPPKKHHQQEDYTKISNTTYKNQSSRVMQGRRRSHHSID
jgi:hypothetical protein